MDGLDDNIDSFDVINQSKNVTNEIVKDIKTLVKDAKSTYLFNYKERGEFIVKTMEERYGQFWTILIGGHYSKVTSFWYNQYLEFYYNGILYILYRCSPEENLIENQIKVIRRESGIDDKMESNIKRIIEEKSLIHKKNLFSRCSDS